MKISLTPAQRDVLEIIKIKRRYGVFLDMGVGKTALMLSLIDYLAFETFECKSFLIIAPSRVATDMAIWQREIEKWDNFSFFDFQLIDGTKERRAKKLANNKASITILSDTLIEWWANEYKTFKNYDMIIVDESSRFKNHKSKKFQRMAKMINPTQRMYLLSGTPVPNGMEDIWSQMFLLDFGERLGKSYYSFIATYFFKRQYALYISKKSKNAILDRIKDICVFAKNDICEMPKFIEEKILLDFEPKKARTYKDFENDYILELDTKEKITAFTRASLICRCLELSNGAIYTKNGRYEEFDDTKINYIKEYSESHPNENIIVCYLFVFDRERMLEKLDCREINDSASINDWNNGKIKIGIMSPYSFQFGANLQQGGHTIMWLGMTWNFESLTQSNHRIWRKGQKNDCKCFYLLMRDTFDEYVYATIKRKDNDETMFNNFILLRKKEYEKIKKGEKLS